MKKNTKNIRVIISNFYLKYGGQFNIFFTICIEKRRKKEKKIIYKEVYFFFLLLFRVGINFMFSLQFGLKNNKILHKINVILFLKKMKVNG